MKTHIQNLFLLLALLASFAQIAPAAVNFNVTPSAVSNTYNGTITLQVTGLTNTETVIVQKFLDANTNGTVDAGDLLMQQFQMTDGSASVFFDGATAVTNFNVPADTDGAANGQITAPLYFGLDFAQLIIGKYLFVLSSPGGHFSPITQPFSVTNFPFGQAFTGNVVSNGAPVPNAVVILFQPSGGGQNPQSGVVANNSGAYTIKTPPGTYLLGAFKSNFVANLAVSPYVTLGAGATNTANVPLTNATQGISGNVIDVNNSSLGLAGCLVPVQTTNNVLTLAFTDTNGSYTARVVPGQWKINSNAKEFVYKGYLGLQNSSKVNTTTGSVAGVTMALPKVTAVFYGTVKDNLGNPVPGVALYCSDNNGNYETDGFTDTNGKYVAGAVGGLNNDQWQVGIDNSSSFPNYNFSFGQQASMSAGQAVRCNFTVILATNHVTGYVSFNGNPVTNLHVNASATINGTNYQAQTDTDSNGNYSLNVANGSWSVSLDCNGGDNSLDSILGSGNYQCPGNQSVTINNNNGTVNFTIQPPGGGPYQIFGHVTDNYGDPVAGVRVSANDGFGGVYHSTTDNSGYYAIYVGQGNWDVSVDCSGLTSLGYGCASDNYITGLISDVENDFFVQFIATSVFPFTNLHGFLTTRTNAIFYSTNSDGASPVAGLVLSGNTLYGTAQYGGTNGNGTVFAVNTSGAGLVVLHTFTALDVATGTTNSDGANPVAGLVLSGNTLYGTAQYGGTNGNGTIFSVNTNGAGFTVLHTFTALDVATGTTNSDGANPVAGLILSDNTLYGTAEIGGSAGCGTVFRLNTNATGFATLHPFTALDAATQTTNSDGAGPVAGLILSGNTLYGTAQGGGGAGSGTVFKVNTNGTGFATLYAFTNGDDGENPAAGLVLSSNVLYGTAFGGSGGGGTVFALGTNGAGFTVLHGFAALDDGANPYAGLILSSNTLYGTVADFGSGGYGTVFAVGINGKAFTVLHSFTGGSDGANPYAALILSGNFLYGTTASGGSGGDGTVFGLSLTAAPSPPQLTITHSGANAILTWPTNATGFTLKSTTNLLPPVVWLTNSPAPTVVNGQNTVTNPISGTKKFYRLTQ